MANPFFGTNEREHFRFGIGLHTEPTLVPLGNGRPKRQHTIIRWILVVLGITCRPTQRFNNRLRSRQIRIAHAQVNDVHPTLNRFSLHVIDRGK